MKPTALLWLVLAAPAAPDPRTAWIEEAQAAHRRADQNDPLAMSALEGFAVRSAPRSVPPDEARAVRQDAWFRAAELWLQRRQPGAARDEAERGLALGKAEDLFTANLLVVRGRARELLQDDRGAVSDYQEALRINEVLLRVGAKP